METPFETGNLENEANETVDFRGNALDLRQALIIQEAGVVSDAGGNFFLDRVSHADDEGRSDGSELGSITFDFNHAISSFGIDLLDIEVNERFYFLFFSNGSEVTVVGLEEFDFDFDFHPNRTRDCIWR